GILGVDLAEIQHLHNLVDHPCGMVWLKKLVGPDAAKDALALIVLSEYRHRPLPSQRYHEGCRRSMKNRPTRQRQVAGQPQFRWHLSSNGYPKPFTCLSRCCGL